MEVAWKCTLHRLAQLPALGEGSLPASCALAGSPAHRTPTIGKMSERFTSMTLRWGGPCRPLLIVTAKCQRLMTESGPQSGMRALANRIPMELHLLVGVLLRRSLPRGKSPSRRRFGTGWAFCPIQIGRAHV